MAITASAMTHNRQTILGEGFHGYVTKPISCKVSWEKWKYRRVE